MQIIVLGRRNMGCMHCLPNVQGAKHAGCTGAGREQAEETESNPNIHLSLQREIDQDGQPCVETLIMSAVRKAHGGVKLTLGPLNSPQSPFQGGHTPPITVIGPTYNVVYVFNCIFIYKMYLNCLNGSMFLCLLSCEPHWMKRWHKNVLKNN